MDLAATTGRPRDGCGTAKSEPVVRLCKLRDAPTPVRRHHSSLGWPDDTRVAQRKRVYGAWGILTRVSRPTPSLCHGTHHTDNHCASICVHAADQEVAQGTRVRGERVVTTADRQLVLRLE